jgi:hypothetical protein
MTRLIRRRACFAAFLALLSVPAPAFADITAIPFGLPYWPSVRNAAAFDSVNQVYLVTRNGSPVSGQFLDKNGNPIGGAFAIASAGEGAFSSWSQIAFGGPPTDPTFLVTYTVIYGSAHLKYGRLIRYRGGAAEVGAPIFLVDTGGQWQAAEKAQSVWFGDHFIAATRVAIGGLPQPVVQRFEMSGAVSAAVSLGDSLDFEGSATLACAPSGTCLATGFAGGYPFGTGGAVFARLFNANTLQPESGLFYLDDHTSRMDDPWVVFNAVTGQFLTVWWQASYAQFRTVSTTGALGSYEHRFGDWAGDIALKFNAATGTTLLTTKWRNFALSESRWADLYAVEVDSNFRMTPVVIATWDGKFPEYWTSIAADEVNGRWLTTSFETAGGRAALVFGSGGGGGRRTTEDFDGDGARDIAVYRPSNGVWYVHGQFAGQWGLPGDVPVAGDYNGDGMTDVAVYRPSTGVWYVHNQFAVQWGWPGDVPVPGDYNGDGVTDVAVWRPSTGMWYVRGHLTVQWGAPGDVPVPGDYNGDGVTDVAVRRPSESKWYVLNQFAVQYGLPNDVAVPGDYNGDGVTDVALWRRSTGTWHVLGQFDVQWGWPEDMPVPGDYNGDGVTDIAVWRPSTGTWHVRGQFDIQFGWPDDVPLGAPR